MDESKVILVTGANGQIGRELSDIATLHDYKFVFCSSKELDITDKGAVEHIIKDLNPAAVINCAAYTKVDLAESESEKAFAVNYHGVVNLVDAISPDCVLVHYSTDYVYDAKAKIPLSESSEVNPTNIYAKSKLAGDDYLLTSDKKAIIIRTSWVYSIYGHNFVKTMIRLAEKLDEIRVVDDQLGSPTYAKDLAKASIAILDQLMSNKSKKFDFNKVYHYANEGYTSWYAFAKMILETLGNSTIITPISSSEYPTPASRPAWSVLDCTLIKESFGINIPIWEDSLKDCLALLAKC